MRNRTGTAVDRESRLMDTEELRAYTNLGRNNAMKLGEEIGAKVQIGRRVLWDRVKVDQYLKESFKSTRGAAVNERRNVDGE